MKEWITKIVFALGIVTLCVSILFPYWQLKVIAPQYPKGLTLVIHLNQISGDVQEINTLNHYIGMRKIDDAAKTERRFAIPGLVIVGLGLLIALLVPRRWSLWFVLPAVLFPLIFAADFYFWLRDSGLNLNPKAPLSSSIKPFVPPLFGHGKIAQFQAFAQFGLGFYLTVLASFLSIIGSFFRFRNRGASSKLGSPRSLKSQSDGGQTNIKAALFVFFVFLFFSLSSNLYADTIVVSPEGPFFELEKAVETAVDGDTILVRGGIHYGPIVITKSLNLIGENNPILDGLGKGTVIRLFGLNTRFSGFTVRNSGEILSTDDTGLFVSGKNSIIENNQLEEVLFGIYLNRASDSIIRNNKLYGKSVAVPRRGDLIRVWYSDRILIEGNQIFEGRDSVVWYSKDSIIRNNFIQGGRYGLHFMYCNNALVENNHLEENSVGAYLMYSADIKVRSNRIVSNRGPSGYGLGFKDMTGSIITHNIIADNRAGFYLDGATGNYQENIVAYNDIGVQMLTSAQRNQFNQNSFIENGEQIFIESMGYLTANEWKRNFWSDYIGFDANQDGIGDTAYEALKFFERLTERYQVLKLFRSSPSVEALEKATTIFPVFAPKPKFSDQEPLIKAEILSIQTSTSISKTWLAVSFVLLLFPFILISGQIVSHVGLFRQLAEEVVG